MVSQRRAGLAKAGIGRVPIPIFRSAILLVLYSKIGSTTSRSTNEDCHLADAARRLGAPIR